MSEQFEHKGRIHYGIPMAHAGEMYRADAKAEGDKVVLGGWEVYGAGDPMVARWFSFGTHEGADPLGVRSWRPVLERRLAGIARDAHMRDGV